MLSDQNLFEVAAGAVQSASYCSHGDVENVGDFTVVSAIDISQDQDLLPILFELPDSVTKLFDLFGLFDARGCRCGGVGRCGRVVEVATAVCGFQSSQAAFTDRFIESDAVEPRKERASPREGIEFEVGGSQGFLRHVFGIFAGGSQRTDHPQQSIGVSPNEGVKRRGIPRFGLLDQATIVTIASGLCGWIIAAGRLDAQFPGPVPDSEGKVRTRGVGLTT